MADLEELAKSKLSAQFLVRREMKKLPEVLGESEEVLNLARGEYDGREGLMVVSDRRVLFLEQGMVRHKLEDFPFDKISSVQTSTGVRSGKLTIFAAGNKHEIKDIHPKQRAVEIGDYVRARVSGPPSPTSAPVPATSPAGDLMDQLKKLGELRDAGVVSQEEFETKKAELLSRM